MRFDVGRGIELHGVEAGSGPPVILCHGFPELWWSWRHQLPALSAAGYRPIALDMRGYGLSSAPDADDAYDAVELAQDVIGVIDALGEEQAVVAGHDWGAVVAWTAAGLHPDRVRGVVGMSVPATPRPPAPPAGLFREHMGEDFYFLWMARPETPALLGKDVRRTLATTKVWNAEWAAQEGDDPPTPPFMTDADLQVYVDAFERTGFENPLRWYRNLDRTWERTADAPPTIDVPAAFITGERDPVGAWMPAQVMDGLVTDLRLSVTVPGAGHWVQQERPAEVNAALIEFLAGLDA